MKYFSFRLAKKRKTKTKKKKTSSEDAKYFTIKEKKEVCQNRYFKENKIKKFGFSIKVERLEITKY